MSNQTLTGYPYAGYAGNDQQKQYVQELFQQERKLQEKRKLSNALFNPKTEYIYLEDPNFRPSRDYSPDTHIPWKSYPKVINTKRFQELSAKSAAGETRHANDDQVEYGFYTDEFVDEALRAHSAGVVTSTEFPAITVTTVSNELLRNELLVAQKYNLLQITEQKAVDQLWVVFPEYNDTTKAVRSGYKENDPIDTTGWGQFTETRIGLEKSGTGIGFTEEFYMRNFTYPIQNFITEHIAQDFVRVKHERLVQLLDTFANVGGQDWGAYTPANLMSTNRPSTNLNTIKTTINADKLASANTIISREDVWIDYDTNTWTRQFGQPIEASNLSQNNVITRPRGIPWCERWIINEDVTANVAYIFDSRAFLMLQGPKKTTQFENNNPQQTIFLQKDWFKQYLRKPTWGRELTGISV
jgi:hypothetical protein